MNWGTCSSGSNNLYFDSPPLMSDERAFTSYDPMNVVNDDIRLKYDIKSNYDYRQFLINHGDKIIKQNQKEAVFSNGLSRFDTYDMDILRVNEGKYLHKDVHDTHRPYGYETSDLKETYLQRQQIQDRLNTPVLNQSELLFYLRDK